MTANNIEKSDKVNTINSARSCPLCNSNHTLQIAQMSAEQIVNSSAYYDESWYARLDVKPNSAFGLSKCQRCDFIYSSSVPSDSFLDKIYSPSNSIESSIATFARPARAAYAFASLSTLLDAISARSAQDKRGVVIQKTKILDVGCAFGVASLGLALEHYPYEISGVEWGHSTREYLSKQGMHTYKQLDEIDSSLRFDGIILNDVLEHVPEPAAFLRQLAGFCHENTAIWVNVPNFIEWRMDAILEQVNQQSMSVPKDMNPWEHLSYFSPTTLNTLMQKSGFERFPSAHVELKIKRGTLLHTAKNLIRILRDSWRIHKGTYPNEFSTSGIFIVKN